jgi:hypothetical protein
VTEGSFWGLSMDLMSAAVVTPPHPRSETEEQLLLDGFGGVGEVRVASGIAAELKPRVPVFGLDAIVHCGSGNRLPASVEVTSDVRSGVRCTSFQD